MNDNCAAGTGRFIDVMAYTLNLGIEEVGSVALSRNNSWKMSNIINCLEVTL
jgi:activator of 2-hydroxyglutaryl-CoA dehydratase